MTAADDRAELSERPGPGFKRRWVVPGAVLTAAEIVFVVVPLVSLFEPSIADRSILVRIAIPVLAGAQLVWFAALATWLSPILRSLQKRRRGERVPRGLSRAAYWATARVPLRALLVRSGLWVAVGLAHGLFLARYAGWVPRQVIELTALTGLHGFVVSCVRGAWYAGLLAGVRARLFPRVPPIRWFSDTYARRLVLVELLVGGGTAAAIAAFVYFFLPLSLEQYLQVQTFLPVWLIGQGAIWYLVGRALWRPLDEFLRDHVGDGDIRAVPDAVAEAKATRMYRLGQMLPYRLAAATLLLWGAGAATLTWWSRSRLRFELDDSVLTLGIIIVSAVGAALYEALSHRETMRPFLDYLTLRHRLPVRGIRTSLSLRVKLLIAFGGVVMFACGMALFWGFVQYKNLVTDFVYKRADLGITWLRSEVQGAAAARGEPPTPELARDVLAGAKRRSPEANAIFYFLPEGRPDGMLAQGGGPMGAPRLPWYARAEIQLDHDGKIDVDSLALTGRHGRLEVTWRGEIYDLGSLAVFYPNYRGRGPSIVRPLKELLVFFLVLFGACAGIVLFTVAQFVKPIRLLEERADGMARGELAEPVSSGGEGDEVGRLTFALEEMRRALREKLRSTEEVNLDLERAVQRRTADLAKKNRELAETLEKLTRAQDQLVRSEKMASIGQLVAGVAHEINNPVNAIVNTVGPLEEAIQAIDSDDEEEKREAAEDVRDMVRVVQRGARRTKAIVQALHNYSRTDDESVVEVDINRSIEDSLELLRHLLKQSITVERSYGDVGKVRGHAGQLGQVFMNLLTNSAQAVTGREGARVEITTARSGGEVVIRIADNGEGIPPDIKARIFDPFFTTKDVGEGSGLGLSIVHGIIERHGGAIEVDSEVEEGTTFTIRLPQRVDAG